MSSNAPGAIVTPPPGTTGPGGKDSTYCQAYRAGLDAWCKDGPGNRKGDFNSYVFKELKTIDGPLHDAISVTREVPIGAVIGGSATPLTQLAGGAAGRMMDALIGLAPRAGGLPYYGAPWISRLVMSSTTRGILRRGGVTGIDRILCPDARTPSGTPIEIKRPSEPESHDDQRNNYAKCSPDGKCVALDAQSCYGPGDYSADCPPPAYP
ncbi:MAG: hypothetical protein KC731_27180 [Myxococcales bacterium]|nr:hypothetical protein [Myxococcales bacterium]